MLRAQGMSAGWGCPDSQPGSTISLERPSGALGSGGMELR